MKKKSIILFILISLSSANGSLNTISIATLKTLTQHRVLVNMNIGNQSKGENIFIKKLRKHCDMSSADFAGVYSQDEWEEIAEAGKFDDIVLEICPKIEDIYQEEWSPDLYQFVYEYASDSGNIPSS